MKAFLAALVALIVISAGADYLLHEAGFSSERVFAGPDVRLGDGG